MANVELLLQRAIPVQPDIVCAIEHREAGRYAESAHVLQDFLINNPQDASAYALLAQVLSLDKRDELAWVALRSALTINPELDIVQRNHARLLLKQQKINEALQAAQSAYQNEATNPENQLVLVAVLGANGQNEQAISLVTSLLQSHPDYAEAFASRALLKIRSNDFVGALEDAEKSLTIKPHLGQLWVMVGSLRHKLENLPGAIEALEKALDFEPDNVGYLLSLGEFKRQIGAVDAAIGLLEKVVVLAPDNAVAWVNLGAAFQQSQRISEAKAAYANALEIRPQQAEVASNMGVLAKDEGDLETALHYFTQALEINPNLVDAHYNCGIVLKDLKRFNEAAQSYERAVELTAEPFVNAPGCGKGANKFRADAIDGLLTAFYLQGARRKLMTQFQRFTKELCDEEDAEFDKLYIAGLDATMTAPSPMRRRDRFRFLLKQFEKTLDISGLIAECGCYRGLSSYLLCNRLKQHDVEFNGAGYQVFDSFAGLSSPGGMDAVVHGETESIQRPGNNLVLAGNFAATLEDVKKSLSEFPGIEYFPGWIPSAFPKTEKTRYRFVHVDVDLYQPTKDSFEYFWPRLVPGGMIVCDDYNWPGAEQAVKEFCRSVGVGFKVSPYGQAYFYKVSA